MKYIQLIYNPMSGNRTFKTRLDYFLEIVEARGYELRIWRTSSVDDFATFFKENDFENCVAVFIAGGDGTVNRGVNAIKKNNLNIPVGAIPAGTANDFATHLGISGTFVEIFRDLV